MVLPVPQVASSSAPVQSSQSPTEAYQTATDEGHSSPAAAAPPTSGIDYSSQNAEEAFRDAISAGQRPSGAMVQATLAGAAPIVDPNEAMIYSAVGLGLSGLLAFKEKAAARDAETEVRINNFMRNYETSRSAFSFLQGMTSYTVADLLIKSSKKGRIISLTKSVRTRIERNIVHADNFNDTLTITELIRYISSSGSVDSMYVVSVSIPILMTELQIYSGNYTNSYNQETNSYNSFRYRTFDNLEIQGSVMNGMGIPSGLIDCFLTCKSSCIQRRSLRVVEDNVESTLKHIILLPASYCESHFFSFSDETDVARNLNEYFSQVKLIHQN
jgi:hypothetical protein